MDYGVYYYRNSQNNKIPVFEYIAKLSIKERAKVIKYIKFLKDSDGYLDEPYSKHINGKIRELRVDFSKNRHRIFYFTFIGKKIILLSAFLKKTSKTPQKEIKKAINNYQDFLTNKKLIKHE